MKGDFNMPTINLTQENMTFKVDASGRVIIPKYLRAKFNIQPGDAVEYFTAQDLEGREYVCIRRSEENDA